MVKHSVLTALEASPIGLVMTYSSLGPYGTIWEFDGPTANGSITIKEDGDQVILDTIDIDPVGTGLGTKIVDFLHDYADRQGKRLEIPAVINLPFFARFNWLSWVEPESEEQLWAATYSPQPARLVQKR